MIPIAPSRFQVAANLPLEQYQKLWDSAMSKVSHVLADLRRPRTIFDVEGYVEELNNFELLTTQEDLNGRIWQEVHLDPTFREAASKKYTAFKGIRAEAKSSPEIAYNVDLYMSIKAILDAEDAKRLMQKWKADLEKSGAYLAPPVREKVLALNKAIDKEECDFLDNLRANHRHLKVDIEELQGMPSDYMSAHPLQSDGRIHIYCKLKDTEPIMDFCRVRSTREKVFRMRRNQAPNNEPVLLRLLEVRNEKAKLLGYKNWAEYQLEGMVLETPDAVNYFLEKGFQALKPQSDWEKRQIDHVLWEKEGIVSQPWDLRYGATLMRAHLLPGFDHAKAREYLLVDKVFPALQTIVSGIFDLRFAPDPTVTAWHPSVTVCNVSDMSNGGKLIGRIFFDLFARGGKIDGSAEYSMRPPVLGKQLAEAVLLANLSNGAKACLSLQDCRNLIHELGHCVHCLVGEQRYALFAG
jgi:thimet oligopeptidase